MKKILTVILCLTMLLLSLGIGAAAVPSPAYFDDVESENEYINYCLQEGLMKGVGDNKFAPKMNVTREQFIQALANLEGIDLSAYELKAQNTPFRDVKPGQWYSAAIEWGRENKIIMGTSATTFSLGIPVTREQVAAFTVRYAQFKGQKTDYDYDLDEFYDNDEISSWAVEGVKYTNALGLYMLGIIQPGLDVNGYIIDYEIFGPKSDFTREELAYTVAKLHKYSKSRIVCWGDSLTMGIETGWEDIVDTPYPERLGEYLGIETVNEGIGSETSDLIAMRQGARAVYVNNITIPAECTPVMVDFEFVTNYLEATDFGTYGFWNTNDVEIAGVRGKLSGNAKSVRDMNTVFWFTRNTPGEEVIIDKPTRIITRGMMDARDDDILIIWSGSNDLYGASDLDYVDNIIENQQMMVDYAGTDEFIIVGFTADQYIGNTAFRDCVDRANEKLAEYWGDKFINLKDYMATEQVLLDNGITPTALDLEYIAKGWVPASLLDSTPLHIHFNQLGYDIVADMIAEKIVELRYLG